MKLIVKDVLRIERGMPRASPSVILKNYLADSFLRFFEILSPWVYRDNRYRSIEMNYLSTIRFKGFINSKIFSYSIIKYNSIFFLDCFIFHLIHYFSHVTLSLFKMQFSEKLITTKKNYVNQIVRLFLKKHGTS